MKRLILLLAALGLLGGRPASGADGVSEAALRDEVEQILQEAQRQERVSGAMAGAIRDFERLVADLKANQLLEEAKGEELAAAAETLDATDRANVRVAARMLRDAGTDAGGRPEKIGSAETEIRTALERLQALLRQANALQAGEMLHALLAKLIQEQEALTARSTEVGKELLAEAPALSHQPEALSREQEEVGKKAAQLEDLLREALAGEMTPTGRERLGEAARIMSEERVRGRLGLAAEGLARQDLMYAVGEQNQALDALRRMAKALSPDAPLITPALREKMAAILDAQKALREKTEGTAKDQFDKQAPDLQLSQKDLENRLAEALKAMQNAESKKMPSDARPAPKPNDYKMPAMGKEDKKGGEGKVSNKSNKELAAKPFPSKMQGSSTSGFGKAGDNPPPDKPAKEGGSDPTEEAGFGPQKAMVEADRALSQKQQQNAVNAMRNAEQEMASVLKAMEQQMLAQSRPKSPPASRPATPKASKPQNSPPAGSEPSPSQGPPSEDDSEQQARSEPDLMPQPAPPEPGKKGRQDFMKTGVYGARPDGTRSGWSSLGQRERDALGQNFARELPREYRDMLRAYYQTLAKE